MTQADRVLSTPPTNTSAHPSSRRGFLAQTAVAVAGGAAFGAALPLPGSAQSLPQVRDPIYSLIERHRELSAHLDAAVSVAGKLLPGPDFDSADEICAERHGALMDHGDNLI